jgi:hypothetical protein
MKCKAGFVHRSPHCGRDGQARRLKLMADMVQNNIDVDRMLSSYCRCPCSPLRTVLCESAGARSNDQVAVRREASSNH